MKIMRSIVLGLITVMLCAAIGATQNVATLANSLTRHLNQATLISHAPSDQPIHLLVWLRGQNPTGLKDLLHNLYTPGNSEYHKFISQDQYRASYAPSGDTVNRVRQYLEDHGLRIDPLPSNNAFISLHTTVYEAEQVFSTTINHYSYRGIPSYSNDSAITVASSIAGLITGVTGLNNFPRIHSFAKQSAGSLRSPYTPQQLQSAYGVDQLLASGINGNGQTIAVIDVCDQASAESDLNIFSLRYFLPSCTSDSGCFTKLNQTGGVLPPACTAASAGWDQEISLDVQSVHSLAPGAKIVLFEAESDDVTALYTTLNTAISLDYKIISNSWGYPEADGSADPFDENILQQAAATGISVSASSGDYADYVDLVGAPSLAYPASSPWVTAVGGTSLFLTADGSYLNEVGWAWPFLSNGLIWGSTGGLSQFFTAQTGQSNAIGQLSAGGYGQISNKRAVPDISMVGDPNTGMAIYASTQSPAWFGEGGTSLACPLFAAVTALVNQSRGSHGLTSIGLVAPRLYLLPYSIHQGMAPITNIVGPLTTTNSVLTGPAGWNDITGLGSPYAPLLLQALLQ